MEPATREPSEPAQESPKEPATSSDAANEAAMPENSMATGAGAKASKAKKPSKGAEDIAEQWEQEATMLIMIY